MNTEYIDNPFGNRNGAVTSAGEIVPIIMDLINPKSVVDVGCGTGEFLSVFKAHNVNKILGIDGPWIDTKDLCIPEESFLNKDLEQPVQLNEKFDMAMSVEVAEHLNHESSRTFVKTLTCLAPVVMFSAAVPYQGGIQHINEQWPEFWAALFEEEDFYPVDIIRDQIWNNNDVEVWYAQNLLLFVSKAYLETNERLLSGFNNTDAKLLSKVHPRMFIETAKKYKSIVNKIPYSIKRIYYKLKKN